MVAGEVAELRDLAVEPVAVGLEGVGVGARRRAEPRLQARAAPPRHGRRLDRFAQADQDDVAAGDEALGATDDRDDARVADLARRRPRDLGAVDQHRIGFSHGDRVAMYRRRARSTGGALGGQGRGRQGEPRSGRRDDVDGVMIAKQKADLAFQLLVQVRNKMLDAYDEIKQMRI